MDIYDIDFNPYLGLVDYIPNPVFSTILNLRNQIILVVTGNRFGKTKGIVRAKAIYPILGMCPVDGHNVRKSDPYRIIRFGAEVLPGDKDNEVSNTVYPQIKYQLPSNLILKDITARNATMACQPILGGKPVFLENVSYGQSAQSQAGVDRKFIIVDEVCPYAFYEESMPRLMAPRLSGNGGQLIIGTTPVEAGWMHTEIYERAKTIIRTPAVRAFIKKAYGQDFPQVEYRDSAVDICVIQAASDDNPLIEVVFNQKMDEIKKGILSKVDFPYETVGEFLDATFMYEDIDTIAMRRYGIFRQITGAVHKEFQWDIHVIPARKYFPNGLPSSWRFARAIDYHQSVPWAIVFAAISPDDEIFIWQEMNPDPHTWTTRKICEAMMENGLDYSYRVNLIDKLATEIQPNSSVNRSAVNEINSILTEFGRISYDKDTYFESWDDKSTIGEDRVRERLINSKICDHPFNNKKVINGKEKLLPTLWICDNCLETGKSLKNWKMESWLDRDAIILKDPKDKKEGKWSHFNKCLEALVKDDRFKPQYDNFSFREREFESYFKGRRQ